MIPRVSPYGLLFCAFLVLIGLVGDLDYQDEIRERDHYCGMVEAGKWPDYREIYDEECLQR